MDTFYYFLQRIRERPGLWLGEKSLKALVHFWHGYSCREHVEAWEKMTSRDFFQNFAEAANSGSLGLPSFYSKHEFNGFVHRYYCVEITTMSGEYLISEKSNSEEEAFDKYFELLDAFCEQKGLPIPYPIPHNNPHAKKDSDM